MCGSQSLLELSKIRTILLNIKLPRIAGQSLHDAEDVRQYIDTVTSSSNATSAVLYNRSASLMFVKLCVYRRQLLQSYVLISRSKPHRSPVTTISFDECISDPSSILQRWSFAGVVATAVRVGDI